MTRNSPSLSVPERDRVVELFRRLTLREVRVTIEVDEPYDPTKNSLEIRVEYVDGEFPWAHTGFDRDATSAAAWLIVTEIFYEGDDPPEVPQQRDIARVLRHYIRTGRITGKSLLLISSIACSTPLGIYLAQYRRG